VLIACGVLTVIAFATLHGFSAVLALVLIVIAGFAIFRRGIKLEIKLAGLVLGLLIVLVSNGIEGWLADKPQQPTATTSGADKSQHSKTVPAADQGYIRAATKYLAAANVSGTKMAEILAAASTGTSSLDDCHAAVLQALGDEDGNYSAYRKTRGTVPQAFVAVDRHIGQSHKNSVAGLSTVLSYWKTGDLESIPSGMDRYKIAIQGMNSTISELKTATENDAQ
jgi:hypothetical protein